MVLLDSNIVIYLHSGGPDGDVAAAYVARQVVSVSAISRVEATGFHGIGDEELAALEAFFVAVATFPVDDAVIDLAAALRRRHRKLKLGDAIIAATAVIEGLELVTRNLKDFMAISGLRTVNPYGG